MSEPALTLDESILRQWLGKSQRMVDTVHRSAGVQMASLLGASLDDASALPPLWHWLYFHDSVATEKLGEDGHARLGGFLPPVDLPRRMWAGGRLVFHQPIEFGDTVEKHSEILSIKRKRGGSGELCFVTVKHTFCRSGSLLLSEEHDIVYREATPSLPVSLEPADRVRASARLVSAPASDSITVTPSVAALFRYSALTFNSHRIHYDRMYCREVENYKGLIFHGPLSATLMAGFAQSVSGQSLKRFDFRALNPIFDTDTFTISRELVGDDCELLARLIDGTEVMRASAVIL